MLTGPIPDLSGSSNLSIMWVVRKLLYTTSCCYSSLLNWLYCFFLTLAESNAAISRTINWPEMFLPTWAACQNWASCKLPLSGGINTVSVREKWARELALHILLSSPPNKLIHIQKLMQVHPKQQAFRVRSQGSAKSKHCFQVCVLDLFPRSIYTAAYTYFLVWSIDWYVDIYLREKKNILNYFSATPGTCILEQPSRRRSM